MLSNTIIVLLIGRNMNYLSTCHQSSLITLLNAIATATAIVGGMCYGQRRTKDNRLTQKCTSMVSNRQKIKRTTKQKMDGLHWRGSMTSRCNKVLETIRKRTNDAERHCSRQTTVEEPNGWNLLDDEYLTWLQYLWDFSTAVGSTEPFTPRHRVNE